jgi:hypothetical protein
MAKETKSIIKEAVLDAERIQEALKGNSKEILRAVSQEEIDEIVKEGLEESEYVVEDVVTEDEDEMDDETGMDDEAGEADSEFGGEAEVEDEIEGDDEIEDTGDMEGSADYEDMESGVEMEPEMGDMDAAEDDVMDMTGASDEDVISVYKKLSGEDEIEVVGDEITLNVSEPGEYVIKTGGGTPAETEMGMDAEPEMGMDAEMGVEPEMGMDAEPEMGMEPEMGAEPEMDYEDEESEVVYEVALDEDTKIGATANGKVRTATSDVEKSMTGDLPSGDIEGQKAPNDSDSGDNLEGGFVEDTPHANAEGPDVMTEGSDDPEDEWEEALGDGAPSSEDIFEEEVALAEGDEITEEDVAEGEEVDETKYVGGKVKKVATAHTNHKLQKESNATKYNNLLTESKNLKKENEEFRKTLKTFRGMLAETVVFNSNLTYVTKLFMEHSITKDEKKVILKRFDEEVSTIKESKKLYKTVSSELKSRKPMNESVNTKINKGGVSSTSKSLNESTAYVDPSTQRIMDLINRVESK